MKAQRITCENDEAEEHRPFPTLNEVLSNVSSDVGFNIEIKYPQVQIVIHNWNFPVRKNNSRMAKMNVMDILNAMNLWT